MIAPIHMLFLPPPEVGLSVILIIFVSEGKKIWHVLLASRMNNKKRAGLVHTYFLN